MYSRFLIKEAGGSKKMSPKIAEMFRIILIYILVLKTTSQSSLILSFNASEEMAHHVKKKL